MSFETIPKRLFAQAQKRGSQPAFFVRKDESWKPTSWQAYGDLVKRAARALISLGFEAGHTVSILGFNRPEWIIFDVAAMTAGGAPAGIYTTCSASEVAYIVSHSEAKIVLVEDSTQLEKIRAHKDELVSLQWVVLMDGAVPSPDDASWVLSWDQFLALSSNTSSDDLQLRINGLKHDQLATLIYTSGTTGPPKGVMLSHENLTWTGTAMASTLGMTATDRGLSYLPLSHIAEQMFTIHCPISTGASVYFAQSIESVAEDVKEVQPTVFFGVPRIWEKFYSRLSEGVGDATGFKKHLLQWVQAVCTKRNREINAGRNPSRVLNVQHAIANKLVLSKLKPKIGLGEARVCVSGAAPIAPEILEFMSSVDVIVNEGYGQSEASGPTTFNRPGATDFNTVGQPVEGVEVRIAKDGEILVRGPNLFLGYYKEPEETAAALDEGWLHSGDLGEIDSDGFVRITGRKKEIIITAGGQNVAPKNIEGTLKLNSLISEAVVIGDRRKFLSALITADEEAVRSLCQTEIGSLSDLLSSKKVSNEIERAVRAVNSDLAQVEQIKKWTLLPTSFGVESGELTPTLKVKRRVVDEHYSTEIEAMYRD